MFKVLVIDHNVTRANLIARALKETKFGLRINYALSATQTLMYFANLTKENGFWPQLVVMSAQLCDSKGLDLLKTLVETLQHLGTPVIVTCERPEQREEIDYYKAGAVAFVGLRGDVPAFIQELSSTVRFVAMMTGLAPRQPQFIPATHYAEPSISEVLQVYI
ncbi:MAG: hypothetical protein HJJLKODD_02947 [Phycisphaerae bacterium]|nr:hypothetical protein [Phycisphaerae bacterium]